MRIIPSIIIGFTFVAVVFGIHAVVAALTGGTS